MALLLTKNKYDVVVVGAGIVGATVACAIAQQAPNLSIALLDAGEAAQLNLAQFDPRVVALSRESARIYTELQVWPDVLASRACAYTDMHVWDGEGTGEIHFDAQSIYEEQLGHIVENSVLVDALQKRLSALPNVEREYGVKVTSYNETKDNSTKDSATKDSANEESAVLSLSNGQSIISKIIVAADGARSSLRDAANINIREWDYGHSAIVTTITTEKPHEYTAWQRFTTDGPIAFLPLNGNKQQNQCSLVWSVTREKADGIMAMGDNAFCQALSRAFENRLGAVVKADARKCFPLFQRHATRYSEGRIVLVGDAAHLIHPLAGQGANLGIYDAISLAEEIARASKRGVPLSDASVFNRYERNRKSHNLATMAGMEGFKRLFGSDDLAVRWLRNEGLRQVNRLPWLKNALVSMATSPKMPKSFL